MSGSRKKKPGEPERRELKLEELQAIVARVQGLSPEEHALLAAAVDTLGFLTRELESKHVSVLRLRRLLFGASTEKTSRVLGAAGKGASSTAAGAGSASPSEPKPKPPRKGHGRHGAPAYQGAERQQIGHAELRHGDLCPACRRGKLAVQPRPAVLVRVTGMAPLRAKVIELERLRCNLCGEVFTARAPPGLGTEKYDASAAAMIALLKYGCGLPFHRLERLQKDLGIPLPAATQWEVVHRAAGKVRAAYEELVRQAAQGEVLHNDDTTMTILELVPSSEQRALEKERTGVFTSGIVSIQGGHRIAVFFTGHQHAGENLSDVLARRAAHLEPPIQMCDALSHNTAGELDTILASCNAHARRRFVDVAHSFPEECRFVLERLKEVYQYDASAREQGLSPEERLRFHQTHSQPVMNALEQWLKDQHESKQVEPNSGLGEAMAYMRKHWQKLTLFLRNPGAPLDNNLCERALKKAILHRKNALFYKTQNGARVGDLFMSLIHTAELCHADPFAYLVALQRHPRQVAERPADWMPWNFTATVAPESPESRSPT